MSFSRSALRLEKGTPTCPGVRVKVPAKGGLCGVPSTLNHPDLVSAVENPGGQGGPEFLAHSVLPPLPQGGRRGRVVESALALCSFLCPQFPC